MKANEQIVQLQRWILGALVLVLIAGCTSSSRNKSDEFPRAKLPSIEAEVRLQRQWRRRVGAGLGTKYVNLAPVIAGDQVFAADAYGRVQARQRSNGTLNWQVRVAKPERSWRSRLNVLSRRDYGFVASLGGGEGLVLIGTTNAELIALAASDGSERWRVKMSSEVLGRPLARNNRVYAQTQDGRLAALSAADGSLHWAYDTQVPTLSLRGVAPPMAQGGGVFAGFASGRVAVLQEATGELIWDHRVMLPQGRSELARIVDVDTPALFTSSAVFVASYQGRIKALRPMDGNVIWEREASTNQQLAEAQGMVFIVDRHDRIRALDQRTGDQIWEQQGLQRRGLTGPVVIGGHLAVADEDGYLHLLAISDGRFVGRTRIQRRGVSSQPVVADGQIYVLGDKGRLVAVTPVARNR